MTNVEYLEIKKRVNMIIALIRWRGGEWNSKEKKVIKELSLIKDYSYSCFKKDI